VANIRAEFAAADVRDRQECYAGPPSGLDAYLTGYAGAAPLA
jgi:hypothetical protein